MPIEIHGHACRGQESRTHRVWRLLKDRCLNENHPRFKDYGGRGITVCSRWLSFENFLEDMGECPEGMTLDRENNDEGYEPGNCRWATTKVQGRNKSNNRLLTYDGRTQCLVDWAEEFGIKTKTLISRLDRQGLSIEKALTTKVYR